MVAGEEMGAQSSNCSAARSARRTQLQLLRTEQLPSLPTPRSAYAKLTNAVLAPFLAALLACPRFLALPQPACKLLCSFPPLRAGGYTRAQGGGRSSRVSGRSSEQEMMRTASTGCPHPEHLCARMWPPRDVQSMGCAGSPVVNAATKAIGSDVVQAERQASEVALAMCTRARALRTHHHVRTKLLREGAYASPDVEQEEESNKRGHADGQTGRDGETIRRPGWREQARRRLLACTLPSLPMSWRISASSCSSAPTIGLPSALPNGLDP
eukprot:1194728-Pleurochrysis_carterae.AAC.1